MNKSEGRKLALELTNEYIRVLKTFREEKLDKCDYKAVNTILYFSSYNFFYHVIGHLLVKMTPIGRKGVLDDLKKTINELEQEMGIVNDSTIQ